VKIKILERIIICRNRWKSTKRWEFRLFALQPPWSEKSAPKDPNLPVVLFPARAVFSPDLLYQRYCGIVLSRLASLGQIAWRDGVAASIYRKWIESEPGR